MIANTEISNQLLTEIKSTHSNNNGTTFHILRKYIDNSSLSNEIEQHISNVQRLDGEASQFKTDASEVKEGEIPLDKVQHEEAELIEHLDKAGSSLAALYQLMDNSKGEKRKLLKVITLESGFYFWTAYKFIEHGTTIITLATENESYKEEFNKAGKNNKGIEFGIKLAKSQKIDQDYERSGGIFNRFDDFN